MSLFVNNFNDWRVVRKTWQKFRFKFIVGVTSDRNRYSKNAYCLEGKFSWLQSKEIQLELFEFCWSWNLANRVRAFNAKIKSKGTKSASLTDFWKKAAHYTDKNVFKKLLSRRLCCRWYINRIRGRGCLGVFCIYKRNQFCWKFRE